MKISKLGGIVAAAVLVLSAVTLSPAARAKEIRDGEYHTRLPGGALVLSEYNFQQEAGAQPDVYGSFELKNQSGGKLHDVKLRVRMRDSNGNIVPGAYVVPHPQSSSGKSDEVLEVGQSRKYGWHWHNDVGLSAFWGPVVEVSGLYDDSVGDHHFRINLHR